MRFGVRDALTNTATIFTAAWGFVATFQPAAAQDRIAGYCCPSLSCRVASAGEVVATPTGFHVPEAAETIGFKDLRLHPSFDTDIHICTRELPEPERGRDQSAIVVKCLYVPMMM